MSKYLSRLKLKTILYWTIKIIMNLNMNNLAQFLNTSTILLCGFREYNKLINTTYN